MPRTRSDKNTATRTTENNKETTTQEMDASLTGSAARSTSTNGTARTTNTNNTMQRRIRQTQAKKVKHNSVNRRTKNARGNGDRDPTPERARNPISFKEKSRMTVKFKIPPHSNLLVTIVNLISNFLKELKKADKKAEVLPYNS